MPSTRPHSSACVIGLDVGTSAVKAALFDRELRELAEVAIPLTTISDAAGRSEQSFPDLVKAVMRALSRIAAAAGDREIVAAGLCTHRSSLVVFDPRTREPRSSLILWNDRRASADAERIARSRSGRRVERLAGLPILPFFFGPRAARLMRPMRTTHPARGALLLTAESALLAALGAETPTTDASMTSRTLLADRDGRFDAQSCRTFSVPFERLATLVNTVGRRGVLDAPGLPRKLRGVPILAALADQSATAIGLAGLASDRTTLTIGTGLFVARGAAAPSTRRGAFPIVFADLGDKILRGVEANDPSTGATHAAFADWFALPSDATEFDALARRATDPVVVVPSLSGLGAPWLVPSARGAILGLSAATSRADIARGLIEGVAARAAELLAVVGGSDAVHVGGGGAASDLLLQRIADRSGRSLVRVATRATGGRGAALLALLGAGLVSARTLEAPPNGRARRFRPLTTPAERRSLELAFEREVRRTLDRTTPAPESRALKVGR